MSEPTAEIFAEFTLQAAHRLPHVPPGHPCGRMHGHRYEIGLHVVGPIDARAGWVVDHAVVQEAFAPLFEQLDHHVLNEVEGLENPTCENLARWLWGRLRPALPGLSRIVIRETERTGCIYRGG